MSDELAGKKVAILVADGFEQVEMTRPREALESAGAKTTLISPNRDKVRSFNHDDPADFFAVDLPLDQAHHEDYDALLLPGGVANPDKLRMNPDAVALVKAIASAGKSIAAICHGPWTLIEAGLARGRTLTSWPSLRTDLQNAGAEFVDEEVVVDKNIVTSRKPADIPAFNREMINEFARAHAAV